MSENAILLSIRPHYADKIFSGVKTVELRRCRPKHVKKGSLALIYVSSPNKVLSGAFRIGRIVEKPIKELWNMVKKKAALSKSEFDAYYKGASKGVALFIGEIWSLRQPITLHKLRKMMHGFIPPQSFRYANSDELKLATSEHLQCLQNRSCLAKGLPHDNA